MAIKMANDVLTKRLKNDLEDIYEALKTGDEAITDLTCLIFIITGSLNNILLVFCYVIFISHHHPAARQFCRSTYTITDITIK
jgi:hypothetical protein